ncbi:MAG: NADH:flavin oxidoreductase [Phycisphaerae bacterium]|nr:NADH:flavin oxidoreductase [Phycisphaerae bacterium]
MSYGCAEFPKVASLRSVDAFNARLTALGLNIHADSRLLLGPDAPLTRPLLIGPASLANRWCINPLEGSDATPDGRPSAWTQRRWRHLGQSGAKLIWGGESVAVRADGRASPSQLLISERNLRSLRGLRELVLDEHNKAFGRNGLLVGLQLTHAGRFACPTRRDCREPKLLYRHPVLDRMFYVSADYPVVSDDWIEELIVAYVTAAEMAADAGFDLVDIKHCHGDIGHEFLSAHARPGAFGGSFENRTRFLERVVEGIRRKAPKLLIGVRLSAYDAVPHEGGVDHVGQPVDVRPLLPYRWAFGLDAGDPSKIDLAEPRKFVKLCRDLGVVAVNVTAGSPHYSWHIQRPSAYAAAGHYGPPGDPLAAVCRLINVAADLKTSCPSIAIIGSGYSYLQDYLPHVAQWVIEHGKADMVGIGRMALSYWELPSDLMIGRPIQPKRICRTFSDCLTAAGRGLPSGCFLFDETYRLSEPGKALRGQKRGSRNGKK